VRRRRSNDGALFVVVVLLAGLIGSSGDDDEKHAAFAAEDEAEGTGGPSRIPRLLRYFTRNRKQSFSLFAAATVLVTTACFGGGSGEVGSDVDSDDDELAALRRLPTSPLLRFGSPGLRVISAVPLSACPCLSFSSWATSRWFSTAAARLLFLVVFFASSSAETTSSSLVVEAVLVTLRILIMADLLLLRVSLYRSESYRIENRAMLGFWSKSGRLRIRDLAAELFFSQRV